MDLAHQRHIAPKSVPKPDYEKLGNWGEIIRLRPYVHHSGAPCVWCGAPLTTEIWRIHQLQFHPAEAAAHFVVERPVGVYSWKRNDVAFGSQRARAMAR